MSVISRNFTLTLFILLLLNACLFSAEQGSKISIIPQPLELKQSTGYFNITPQTQVVVESGNDEAKAVADYLAQKISMVTGYKIEVRSNDKSVNTENLILLTTQKASKKLGAEGYELVVKPESIVLKANAPSGMFYGVQTLVQLLPAAIEGKEKAEAIIPCVKIKDKPRYPYRGMHLDVCRHFMPKEFVKKYIDLMAMYKMNTFHWHLTEDQGWRIEIKKYPKLKEISAWRKETLVGHSHADTQQFDGIRHGGFYTQDEIKEIVAYAKSRFITVIPEIEMPGHSVAALAAYPELSCTGGPFEVQTFWGVSDDVYCAGKEKTFEFLTDVLSEVIDLFPSKYIHIGGDECPKARWRECPDCQARIKAENLKDEYELQSYFIKRIEKFLVSKNRQLIGWDEILEGGLAPEATVMSWRGFEGGVAAAQQKHDVIMTPTSHCYFDYYQADPDFEPLGIGGFITLKKVYSFEPTPPDLNKNEAKHILGAQGNVWTEYMKTPEHVEYMMMPRMLALSEVVWSSKEKRDWNDFQGRLQTHFKRFVQLGVNYCKGSFKVDISSQVNPKNGKINIVLESEQLNPEIRYSIDGSEPNHESMLYNEPFTIDKTCLVRAGIFADGNLLRSFSEKEIYVHKAIGKKVTLKNSYEEKYSAGGDWALVDGISGTENFRDGFWQGYDSPQFEAVIDFEKMIPLQHVKTRFLQDRWYYVFLPRGVQIAISQDGKHFEDVKVTVDVTADTTERIALKNITADIDNKPARFVRVTAQNDLHQIDLQQAPGGKVWLFVDEIFVE